MKKKLTKEDLERASRIAVEKQKKYLESNPKSAAWWMAVANLNRGFTPNTKEISDGNNIKRLQKL